MDKLPDIDKLTCTTTFIHPDTKEETLEVCGYKYIDVENAVNEFYKPFKAILPNIIETYIKN